MTLTRILVMILTGPGSCQASLAPHTCCWLVTCRSASACSRPGLTRPKSCYLVYRGGRLLATIVVAAAATGTGGRWAGKRCLQLLANQPGPMGGEVCEIIRQRDPESPLLRWASLCHPLIESQLRAHQAERP